MAFLIKSTQIDHDNIEVGDNIEYHFCKTNTHQCI